MPFARLVVLAGLTLTLASAATAQDMPLAPLSNYGKVAISGKQTGGGFVAFEQAFGGAFDAEPASKYPESSELRRLGRAVGRLDVAFDRGVGYCTGFLISDQYLMTNAHCIDAGPVQSISFVTGYVESGVEKGTRIYTVGANPVELSPRDELDYAILQVFGNPTKEWGTVTLAALEIDGTRDAGMPLLVMGHPIFQVAPQPVPQPLYLSRKECRATVTTPVAGTKLRHTCDTLVGNSGSPVFSDDSREVIALHHAGDPREGINFAIPMSLIAQDSQIVAELVAANRPAQVVAPPVDTGELDAAFAFGDAVALPGIEARIAALQALIATYPGTRAAGRAEARLTADQARLAEERAKQAEADKRARDKAEADRLAREKAAAAEAARRDAELRKLREDAAMTAYLAAIAETDVDRQITMLEALRRDFADTRVSLLIDAAVASARQSNPAKADPLEQTLGEVGEAALLATEVAVQQIRGEPVKWLGDTGLYPITAFGDETVFIEYGRAVGRLDMLFSDGKTGYCTAFVAGENQLLVPSFCVPGTRVDQGVTVTAAQFVTGFVVEGSSDEVVRYTVSADPLETNEEVGYSVLRVFGDVAENLGVLKLSAAIPDKDAPLWLIGHPMGQAQHIDLDDCRYTGQGMVKGDRLPHLCGTIAGMSGAPLIDVSTQRVIGIHYSRNPDTGMAHAIPMGDILATSTILTAAPD